MSIGHTEQLGIPTHLDDTEAAGKATFVGTNVSRQSGLDPLSAQLDSPAIASSDPNARRTYSTEGYTELAQRLSSPRRPSSGIRPTLQRPNGPGKRKLKLGAAFALGLLVGAGLGLLAGHVGAVIGFALFVGVAVAALVYIYFKYEDSLAAGRADSRQHAVEELDQDGCLGPQDKENLRNIDGATWERFEQYGEIFGRVEVRRKRDPVQSMEFRETIKKALVLCAAKRGVQEAEKLGDALHNYARAELARADLSAPDFTPFDERMVSLFESAQGEDNDGFREIADEIVRHWSTMPEGMIE